MSTSMLSSHPFNAQFVIESLLITEESVHLQQQIYGVVNAWQSMKPETGFVYGSRNDIRQYGGYYVIKHIPSVSQDPAN